MEKITSILYTLGLVTILFLNYFSVRFGYEVTMESLVYWYILFGLILFILKKRVKSKDVLILALLIYILASIVSMLSRDIGEDIMRLSFECLIVGFGLVFLEKIRNEK